MMLKYLALSLFSSLAVTTPPIDVTETRAAQDAVIGDMTVPGVSVVVARGECGDENAFYAPGYRTVYLCDELTAHPGHAVFAAAHEMGHAWVDQLGLAVDDDIKANERAADELAALALIATDRRDDLLAAALFYRSRTSPVPAGDEHPDNRTRGWELACLEAGSEDGTPECVVLFHAVLQRWVLELEASGLKPPPEDG